MSVGAMVEELNHLGVKLRVADGDLEYEGPEKAITPELLERLKAYKADLIAICAKAETVAKEGRKPGEDVRMQATADPDACKLSAAGWESKERGGKVIWKRPDNGFYYSKEVSLHLLNQKEHTGQERGNRKQVTQRGGDS